MIVSLAKWKEREKVERQNDIINATRKLIGHKDFDEISMDEIAKEIGLGKSTLYLYFKNKESLYFAVVLKGIKIWEEMVKNGVNHSDNGLEMLISYKNANKEFSNQYPEYFSLLYSPTSIKKQFNMEKMENSQEFQEVRKVFKEILTVGIDAIQKASEEGTIRKEVDPVEAIILLSIIYNGRVNMGDWSKELLNSRGIDDEKFNSDIGDFFLKMLTK
ncbi:transcriptional regulator, TetR family [Methanobacterium lacus]|jgi:TetR/AcrR family transcriptional regulator|uniref:Transcriptional regulator, TetR family n=1 Tax=Methanobacterium lacus (strain AL-21) TaxID=877455 RepID=F0T690_METLA|nr:TetR/AcrR family transcriptional regulator [Methanobacterium lacus]ADZ09405.1 transcriptional regulator, TetR family [Methanobacterium lacus]